MESEQPVPSDSPIPRSRRRRKVAIAFAVAIIAYVVVAYVIMPFHWNRYEKRHPWLDEVPGITQTKDGIPGDPLNVALVGTEDSIKEVMRAAGWFPADPLSLRSDLKIAADTVFKRQYDDAPVSNLYLFGRKEDLAFEQPVGPDPRHRNHVRFWRTNKPDPDGRPTWVGSATYDERVGLSHTTGEITHHIAPDVDAERDHLFEDLQKTGDLASTDVVNGFHKVLEGRNGGGDPWHTDGRLFVGVIRQP